MKKMIYLLSFVFLVSVVFAGTRGECQDISNMPAITVGTTREYEIELPMEGYIGSPVSTSNVIMYGKPIIGKDFKKKFIKVTIIGVSKRGNAHRISMRIDEIESRGGMLVDGLYYLYMDIFPHGTHVICRGLNDGHDSNESDLIVSGIPFPFSCARPPSFGFKGGKRDGYVDFAGEGVEFTYDGCNINSGTIDIDAAYFDGSAHLVKKTTSNTFEYRSDIDTIKNNPRTKIIFTERQRWSSANSWLWDEMDRVDKEGNLMMRCKRR